MYESSCFKQIQEIIGIDRILNEQLMECDWDEPKLAIKRKNDLKSIRNATVAFYSVGPKMSKTGNIFHYQYCDLKYNLLDIFFCRK